MFKRTFFEQNFYRSVKLCFSPAHESGASTQKVCAEVLAMKINKSVMHSPLMGTWNFMLTGLLWKVLK